MSPPCAASAAGVARVGGSGGMGPEGYSRCPENGPERDGRNDHADVVPVPTQSGCHDSEQPACQNCGQDSGSTDRSTMAKPAFEFLHARHRGRRQKKQGDNRKGEEEEKASDQKDDERHPDRAAGFPRRNGSRNRTGTPRENEHGDEKRPEIAVTPSNRSNFRPLTAPLPEGCRLSGCSGSAWHNRRACLAGRVRECPAVRPVGTCPPARRQGKLMGLCHCPCGGNAMVAFCPPPRRRS